MFEFVLNGQVVHVPEASADMTLLDYLRSRGLTGAKEGCAEGECGACAVVMRSGRPNEAGSEYRAVNSCLMLLPMAAGREIDTVETLAEDGRLAPAQQALAAAGGSQCGYCTPGFVMSLMAEYYRPGRVGACDPTALDGNLCRCTGYRPIADAARSLGPAPPDRFSARLEQSVPPLEQVVVDGFSRPTSVEACVALLRENPTATLVAGGTDLVVERNLRQRRWPHLVSVEAIEELHTLSDTPEWVRIGAARPLADLLRGWSDAPAAVREWVTLFASPLIRHRATLGGNLATASPIGDGAPLLLALDASIEIASPGRDDTDPLAGLGEAALPADRPDLPTLSTFPPSALPHGGSRWAGLGEPALPSSRSTGIGERQVARRVLPLADFFTAYRKTRLAPGELIVAIRIPRPLPRRLQFYKVTKRRLDDISTIAAGIAIDAPAGVVERARIAFGGVAATPVRLPEVEAALEGQPWTPATISRAQDVIRRVLQPLSDHRGSREYRLAMACSLVEKCWWESQP